MRVLAIETTGANASVALVEKGGDVRMEITTERMNHLQFLMPMIEKLMKDCKMQIGDVDAIAVSEGPGSFTGVRIGVSSARGLCQWLGKPCLPVPTLDSFRYNEGMGEGKLALVLFDARRNQVYAEALTVKDGKSVALVPGGAYMFGEFMGLVKEALLNNIENYPGAFSQVLCYGDGAAKFTIAISEEIETVLSNCDIRFPGDSSGYQRADAIGKYALDMIEAAGGTERFMDYTSVVPNYMRRAEAEQKLAPEKAAEYDRAQDTIKNAVEF